MSLWSNIYLILIKLKKLSSMKNKGFTLLYAIVVTSILLASSLSIISIALRELALTTSARESQYAFYIANTGLECALYWDLRGTDEIDPGPPEEVIVANIFPEPIVGGGYDVAYTGSDPIVCLSHDIRGDVGGDTDHYQTDSSVIYPDDEWLIQQATNPSTAQFRISFGGTPEDACADVVVTKYDNGSEIETTIESRGYNTCETSKRRVERGVELRY